MRQMAEGVALRLAALVGDRLIAPGEGNRLEREERNLLRIIQRELNDASHLLVVHAVDDGRHRHDLHSGAVQVFNRAQLYVKQIADRAMRVCGVADAVKLQIGVAQTGLRRLLAELRRLGKLDSVGRRLHRVVAHLAGVGHGLQKMRRQRWLATAENCTLICRRGLMVMALSSIVLMSSQPSSWTKPTWLASMKQGSHIMLQRFVRSMVSTEPRPYFTVERAVIVQPLVVVRAHVAPRETLFQMAEELRVHGHHVFKVTVLRAVLHHQNLAVALDDLSLDLAHFFVQQNLVGQLAVHNLLANLRHALGAQRVSRARPTERRLGLLIALQQRLVCPLRGDRRPLVDAVQLLKNHPRTLCHVGEGLLDILDRLMHEPLSPG